MPPEHDLPELVSAIADETDPKFRTLLMLVFKGMARLEKKLDNLMKDEQQLRRTVLDGHAEDFDPVMRWAKERMENGGLCPRMRQMLEDEAEAKVANKNSWRKIRDGMLEKILYAAFGAAGYAIGLWFYFRSGIGD